MNTMQLINTFGQLNSIQVNFLEVDGIGGDQALVLGSMGAGEAFPPLLVIDFPSINPRVCIPAETRTTKVEC
jgi:hypothetical protein